MPKGYEPFVREFAKIAVFLQNEEQVLTQLKKLNSLLEIEALNRHLVISENDKGGYLKHKKVLRSVLEQELEKMGFQADLAKATGFLTPEVFGSSIREGLLIKDPGAGIEHGEFTHAIQWLIIGWQQNDTQFLNHTVIEVYKQLGNELSVQGKSINGERNIWDILVDENILICKDYRCPEYLHSAILKSEDPNLTLLKKLCQSRVIKRETNASSNLFHESKEFPKKEYDQSNDSKDLLIPRKKNNRS